MKLVHAIKHWCERHNKALHHMHHGFHTSYLGIYVWDWHIPVSPIALGLLILAIVSWLFKFEAGDLT